ncbi:MAG: 4-(cytidine 5'-diphospho)-2-C-methyl-D-erythritol kinase [Candidatus Omnitrophica bacterium]|nr:4-(cytidine 5'-diphospho)-2-C-methyl-D-erythritol kinase [Candidatus Omnitrophota bacterium]
MRSITLTAPAKVNLFLKVLNKREDGYHNIFTLFERISLADKITITAIPKGIRVSSDKSITADPKDNLVYKAAELILKHAKIAKGVNIRIKKVIPIAAGLGGGSSDAASTLIGINKLFSLRFPENKLLFLAEKLGADVPFFVLNSDFALGKGKGGDLTRIKSNIKLWHLIIYTGSKTSTRDIYDAFDLKAKRLTFDGADDKIPRYLSGSFDRGVLEKMLCNDLEDAAISKNLGLKIIIERLASSLGKKAIVSGSGPSVFCLCSTGKEAMAAKRELFKAVPAGERKEWQVFIARTK